MTEREKFETAFKKTNFYKLALKACDDNGWSPFDIFGLSVCGDFYRNTYV